ncbi:uncharacterized protein F5891DRAFT_144747 [Suillus fuscotomentosus]|uniref:Uncharacterized protein n=1 Tax=Suillus fuscotomentosus TaxID=1912939 RepID=A0AAD4EB01_9AGAM|nr:uncharacterized protein F5891DRAFT_144747 [Suillus fuscotomentosus]KAG1902626.1 hypothetical protein F5891DRAFT_144747 [Suillus fuscotomentosus]
MTHVGSPPADKINGNIIALNALAGIPLRLFSSLRTWISLMILPPPPSLTQVPMHTGLTRQTMVLQTIRYLSMKLPKADTLRRRFFLQNHPAVWLAFSMKDTVLLSISPMM